MFEKKKKKIEGVEKDAKMSVLEGLRDMASNAMGDKLKNLKKVTVASDSEAGLKEGLNKAEELLKGKSMTMGEPKGLAAHMEEPEEESEEAPEEMSSEKKDFDDMSEDELDAALKRLMELKKAKSE